jgi:two-component system sensor histidine kinase HydH
MQSRTPPGRKARWKWGGRLPYLLLLLSFGFPLVLVLDAVFAARELKEMRAIFLRDRAAGIAARLEALPPEQLGRRDFDDLLEGDPALLAIRAFRHSDPASGNPALQAVREGRKLYDTEEIRAGRESVFRAYVPFHSGGETYVAQIDLSASAPDFMLVYARRTLWMATASGAILVLLSFYAVWSMRRAARLELERQETARLAHLGTLAAVLAHEIRNPLGAIKGFAQLAHENASPPNRKPLAAIVRETRRLETLVNSLLLYGRTPEPVIRPADWEAVSTDLAAFAREAIGTRPIRFTSESRIARLSTDPELLKQALLNLIRNSVEAIPDGQNGSVSLRAAAAADGAVVISVEDDGPGVPEPVRAELFSPFVTTKASGTGLGLAISRKLVETLGGTLRLLPREPHGTRAELAFHGTNSGN